VSVAVVQRTIIRKLRVWDPVALTHIELAPGAAIEHWRIRRHAQTEIDAGAEPYSVTFECDGRECECPLPEFQARTQATADGNAAGAGAIAV
jgi:hypothetical protein